MICTATILMATPGSDTMLEEEAAAMSVRASVLDTIVSIPAAGLWALLLAPFLLVVAVWHRFYRRITVPAVSADWLERHKRDAHKYRMF